MRLQGRMERLIKLNHQLHALKALWFLQCLLSQALRTAKDNGRLRAAVGGCALALLTSSCPHQPQGPT